MSSSKPPIKKKSGDKEERSAFLILAEKLYAPNYLKEEESEETTEGGFLRILGRASKPVKPQRDKEK